MSNEIFEDAQGIHNAPRSNVIFETECQKLEIEFTIKNVKKIDPKTHSTIWSADVAFPDDCVGFTTLMGEKRAHDFLCDKMSIWLRSQNDPRRVTSEIEIDGTKYTKAQLVELGKQAAREKRDK